VQFYYLLEELKINNEDDRNFKQNFVKNYLSEPTEDNVLEIYDMAMNLNMLDLKHKCLQFLIGRGFKDLTSKNETINALTEISFIQLMNRALSKVSGGSVNRLKEYEDLVFNFFQRKAITYSQELFKTCISHNTSNQIDFVDSNRVVIPDMSISSEQIQSSQGNPIWLERLLLQTKTMLKQINKECKSLKKECSELMIHNQALQKDVLIRDGPTVELQKTCSQFQQLLQHQPSPQQEQFVQQPISTQGIVINGASSLIMSSNFDKLKEWIPNHASRKTCRLDLLYKGSRDGFQTQTFHQMCDNRSPTIIFIKSQTYGRIFGGYTAQTWNHTAGYTKDEKAFLFSLTHNEKYPVADPDKAIFGRNDFSATFGAGNDLHISDSSNTKAGSCTGFPYSYKCSKFTTVTEESKAYLAGSCWFTVEEIEVYQIV